MKIRKVSQLFTKDGEEIFAFGHSLKYGGYVWLSNDKVQTEAGWGDMTNDGFKFAYNGGK